MKIRAVVFEFIVSRQTDRQTDRKKDRQTDRRGGGLYFIICIDNNIRLDLEKMGINAVNWVDSAQDCECGIETPGPISHRVN